MIKSLRRHCRRLEEGTSKEISIQSFSKNVSDGADVTFCGRLFHSREAATGKARSPVVERRVRRTTSDDVEAKWRRRRASMTSADW